MMNSIDRFTGGSGHRHESSKHVGLPICQQ
jgi:hypothetical protein